MSANVGSSSKRSRSPSNDYAKKSKSGMDKSEFSRLKVNIARFGIKGTVSNAPLERDIDDPVKVCAHVHVRKGKPPRIPIFGGDIEVNQDFSENRTVFTHERNSRHSRNSRSRSRSRTNIYRSKSKDKSRRSRSRDRTHSRERNRSRSRTRERNRTRSRERNRNRERIRNRSNSRSRRSRSRYRSRSRERHTPERRRRHSYERSRRSRSPSTHEPTCPRYKSPNRRRRSITPLRPGEYIPGHPDLALRRTERKSRSRSRGRRSRSRNRRSRSKDKFSSMPMHGIDYGYFNGFAPVPMHPFRARFPMPDPNFYPRMYIPNTMMPRIPMNPMMPRMPRPRLPVYNSRIIGKPVDPKPATITSNDEQQGVVIEHPNEDREVTEAVSSSNKQADTSAVQSNS